MINSKNVVSALRRDVAFVWHAVIAVVFIGFATLAVAAALLDLLSIRHNGGAGGYWWRCPLKSSTAKRTTLFEAARSI